MSATTQLRPVSQLIAEVVDHDRPSVMYLVAEMNAGHAVDRPPDAAAVLARHPEVATNSSIVRALAYEEFCQRLEAGERLDPIAFAARFPACQTSLRRLVSAHHHFARRIDLQPAPEVLAELVAGNTFFGFTLLQELGRGKTARVFLAHEPALGNRPVALKISCLGTAEAETLGRLRHPNIVQVHSVQRDAASDLTVVCMAYHGQATLEDVMDHAFQGPNLPTRASVIRDAIQNASGPDAALPGAQSTPLATPCGRGTYVDGILDLALPLAEALAFVHAQGIYHRDLKPSNVLVSPGRAAAAARLQSQLQRPDQQPFRGRHHPVHGPGAAAGHGPAPRRRYLPARRADRPVRAGRDPVSAAHGPAPLWTGAVGACRRGRSTYSWSNVSGTRPTPSASSTRRVDRPLQRLIEQCLARHNPNDRPTSAEEVVRGLRAARSRLRRGRRWLVAHPVLLAAAGVLLLASVGGAAYALSLRDPDDVRAFQQGQQASAQGRHAEAVQHFNRALDANAARADVLFARGRAHQALKEYDAAVADYCAALHLPGDSDVQGPIRACLAYCLDQRNNHEGAIGQYEHLERAGWKTAGMLTNFGWSRMQVRGAARKQAEACFTLAIALDAKLLPAFYNRAEWRLRKAIANDQYSSEPGIADIQQAVELAPDSAWLRYEAARHYAVALWNTKRPAYLTRALEAVKQALDRGLGAERMAADALLKRVLGHEARWRELLAAAPPAQPHVAPPSRWADPLHGLNH